MKYKINFKFLSNVFFLLLAAQLIVACAVNPVTGKRELNFVSEKKEISIGEKNYLPTQQSQGGEYSIDKELSLYVNSVGQKLVKVSDRPNLPYEFVVLNNSVPNAWALPGGKIAVNRGLLLELNNEAELAAVLGHEIVHAAARHGAKSMERGLLLQAGVIGLGVAVGNERGGNLAVGAGLLGVNLINSKYGRNAELESDYYGMRYMTKAGYDPRAAIALQKTFVKLSKSQKQNWLDGLFASHPPSQERVDTNITTAKKLAQGGQLGIDRYKEKMATLIRTKKAYAAIDEGRKALAKKNNKKALSLANEAIKIEPKEAMAYGLKGDSHLNLKQYKQALSEYDNAIKRNNNFFQYYLQRGLVKQKLNDKSGAQVDLKKSNALLPTAKAHQALGQLALFAGNKRQALQHFNVAAESNSATGKQAAMERAKLELPLQPNKYIVFRITRDPRGYVKLILENRSPVSITNVLVDVVQLGTSAASREKVRVAFRSVIPAAGQSVANTKIGPIKTDRLLQNLRVNVVHAEVIS